MTEIADHGVSDEVYDTAAEHFSEAELAALDLPQHDHQRLDTTRGGREADAVTRTPISPRAPTPCAPCIAPARRSCCATPGTRPAPGRSSPTRRRWPRPAWGWRSRSATTTAATSPPTEAFAALARIVAAVDVAGHRRLRGRLRPRARGLRRRPAGRRRGRLQPRGHRPRHAAPCATRASRPSSSPRSRRRAAPPASTSCSTRASTCTCAAARSRTASCAPAPTARRAPTASIRSSATTRRGSPPTSRPSAVVNVAVHPSAPTLARMGELGVARASFGGGALPRGDEGGRELRAVDRAQPDPDERVDQLAGGERLGLDEVLVHRALGHPAQRERGRLRVLDDGRGRPPARARCAGGWRRRSARACRARTARPPRRRSRPRRWRAAGRRARRRARRCWSAPRASRARARPRPRTRCRPAGRAAR